MEPAEHDMAYLNLYGPAEDILAIYSYADKAARVPRPTGQNDTRLIPARRFDAIANLCVQATAGELPGIDTRLVAEHREHRPAVQVTVALTTLLGLDQLPGELAGYGPITAHTARRLATNGTWRRLITDPISGVCLDYDRKVYEPPPDLREFVLTRDTTCAFPNCDRRAHTSHLDHIDDWANGGTTSASNLAPLCQRHHRLKHELSWTYLTDAKDPGAYTWTSPTGHTYYREPNRYTEPRPDPSARSPGITTTTSDHSLPLRPQHRQRQERRTIQNCHRSEVDARCKATVRALDFRVPAPFTTFVE